MSNTMIMYSRLVIRALRFAAPHQLRDPGCYLKDPGVPERKVAWLAVPLAVHVSRKSPRSSKLVPYALTWLGVFGMHSHGSVFSACTHMARCFRRDSDSMDHH